MAIGPLNDIHCAGAIFLARNTQRFLFLLRAQGRTAGTWGFAGGKQEPQDNSTLDTLHREIFEELGDTPQIQKIIPIERYASNDEAFYYHTFVLIVDNEFIPHLNNEHNGYAWVNYNFWPKPLHHGVRTTLGSKINQTKLETIIQVLKPGQLY